MLSLPFRAELDNFVDLAREHGKLDDPKVRQPDITRATEILQWAPQVPPDEGLTKTLEDFRRRLHL